MTKKGFLIAAFCVAAATPFSPLAAGLLAGASFLNLCAGSIAKQISKYAMQHEEGYPITTSRCLTEDEKALVKSIFGRKIRTRGVKLYFSPNSNPDMCAETLGKNIKFYGQDNHEEDYSRTKNADNYNMFIHEMTHVWQQQHFLRRLLRILIFTRDYDYWLKKSRFKHFNTGFQLGGVEQQASVVGDYAEKFLYYKNDVNGGNYYHQRHYDSLASLAQITERKFPKARKTRLKLETEETVAAAPPARGNGLLKKNIT